MNASYLKMFFLQRTLDQTLARSHLPLPVIQNVLWGICKFCFWRCTCTEDNTRNYGLLCRALTQKRLTATSLQVLSVKKSQFQGDLEERSFLSVKEEWLISRNTRLQKGKKAATNGLCERFLVGPVVFMEEVSVLVTLVGSLSLQLCHLSQLHVHPLTH